MIESGKIQERRESGGG